MIIGRGSSLQRERAPGSTVLHLSIKLGFVFDYVLSGAKHNGSVTKVFAIFLEDAFRIAEKFDRS